MISVGLDLSLAKTGVVILNDGEKVFEGLIKSKPTGDSSREETVRLIEICNDIELTIEDNLGDEAPDIVVIEGLAFMAQGTSLVQLAGLNYMVRSMLVSQEWPFQIVAPSTLKKFVTGSGASKKDVMLLETYKVWGESFLDDNICDAFGLAKIGEALISDDIGITLNKPQKEVLNLLNKSWKNDPPSV